jgi:hypothetical protein
VARRLSRSHLEAFCLELLADLALRPPFSPQDLCERLARRRGRAIKLQAADLGATTSIGHLVVQEQRDRILYERSAPIAQQATVIYHEVIHLVRDHLSGQTALTCGTPAEEDDTSPGLTGSLYSGWQEWEAEAGGRILAQLSRRRARPDSLLLPSDHPEHGIAAAFGLRATDWT